MEDASSLLEMKGKKILATVETFSKKNKNVYISGIYCTHWHSD